MGSLHRIHVKCIVKSVSDMGKKEKKEKPAMVISFSSESAGKSVKDRYRHIRKQYTWMLTFLYYKTEYKATDF